MPLSSCWLCLLEATRLGQGEEEGALLPLADLVIVNSAPGRSGVRVHAEQVELEIEQEESYGQQLVEVLAFSIDQKCNFAKETVRIREYLRETVVSARMVFWERAAKLVSWILKKNCKLFTQGGSNSWTLWYSARKQLLNIVNGRGWIDWSLQNLSGSYL